MNRKHLYVGYLRNSSGAGLNLEPVPVVQEYSSIDVRLPTPVPGRPGLRISTWKLGMGLPCSERRSTLLVDILPMLFLLVTLGLEGIRILAGSFLAVPVPGTSE